MFQNNCKSDRIFVTPHNTLFDRNSYEVTKPDAKHNDLSHRTSDKNQQWFFLMISTRKLKNMYFLKQTMKNFKLMMKITKINFSKIVDHKFLFNRNFDSIVHETY